MEDGWEVGGSPVRWGVWLAALILDSDRNEELVCWVIFVGYRVIGGRDVGATLHLQTEMMESVEGLRRDKPKKF